MRDEKGRFVKGHTPWHKGKTGVYSGQALVQMSKTKKGKRFSPETEFKKGVIPWNTGKEVPQKQWDKHHNFTTGHTRYRSYFVRNGGKPVCDGCGKKGRFASNSIHIHHKDGNRDNNIMENLQPLCSDCHLNLHENWRGRWG